MAARRKIFRIEEMAAARPFPGTRRDCDIAPERGTRRAATPQSGAAPALADLTARIAGELDAVIRDSEQATRTILAAGECIDNAAANLLATLRGNFEHGLVQDVREAAAQIFEACNFADLNRQRVAKVTKLVDRIEREIAGPLDEQAPLPIAPLLHGPPLPNDPGHVTQSEIDAILAADELA